MTPLRHVRIEVALHELSARDGVPLLLLHALGASSTAWGELPGAWPGPVLGLDFSGHGASQRLRGGVYLPELLAGDVDTALAEIGPAHLLGAGLGAYVALLVAGARPALVPGALLLPGRGLEGGGGEPDFDRPALVSATPALHAPLPAGCDPCCCMLACDPRPPDYAARFAAAARRLVLCEDGTPRPPWWAAAGAAVGAEVVGGDQRAALARLHAQGGAPPRPPSVLRPRRG